MIKLVVGITGASGVIYGVRLLELVRDRTDVETHLVISEMGRATLAMETDLPARAVEDLADHAYNVRDLGAAISSGSFRVDGMVVAPCSVRTLSAIARSANDNLLTRAADVALKERRRLVLLFRETPLHEGHCRLMADVSRMGGVLLPPVPAFYMRPKTIAQMIDQTLARVLAFWNIDVGLPGWGA